jgi:hypothetical protein
MPFWQVQQGKRSPVKYLVWLITRFSLCCFYHIIKINFWNKNLLAGKGKNFNFPTALWVGG